MNLSNKKIVIVLCSFLLGGAEKQAFYLAKYLQEVEKAKVEVWATGFDGPLIVLCNKSNIKTVEYKFVWYSGYIVGPFMFVQQLICLSQKLRKSKPDVIISYTSLPNLISSFIWKFTGAKGHIWQQRDCGLNRPNKMLEKIASLLPSYFISNSNAGANFLKNFLHIPLNKIFVIQNAAVLPIALYSKEEWYFKANVTCNDFVVVMVANLSKNKDHSTLIKAWNCLIKDHELNWIPKKLLLAGRLDDKANEIKKMVRLKNITDSVLFLDFVDDISGLLKIANLFIYSSNSEGCSNGILEAMLQGLPIIANDIPGIRESFPEKNYCCLYKTGDYLDMYNKIKELIINKEKMKIIGFQNKYFAEQNYSLLAMCNKTADLIKKLIGA